VQRRRFLATSLAMMAAAPARLVAGPAVSSSAPLPAPQTPKVPVRIEQLGRVRVDDYAWLKDPHWLDVWRDPSRLDPAIRAHLEEENRYCDAMLAGTGRLQEHLYREMRLRSSGDATPPPLAEGPFAYYRYFRRDAEQPTYARRAVGGGDEQLLVDGPQRSAGRGYFALPAVTHSPDHQLVAWAEDDTGSEKFKVYVRDLGGGAVLDAVISDCFGIFTFSADSKWLYWVWRDANSRPRRVYRRPARGGADVLVYEESDQSQFMTVARLRSDAYVKIRIFNGHASEVRLIPSSDPTAEPRLVEARSADLDYDVEHWHDQLVIRTNADGAFDYKLMVAAPDAPGRAGWRELVPHRAGHLIEEVLAFDQHLVRVERFDANRQLVITARGSLAEHPVTFEEEAYTVECDAGSPYASSSLRLAMESPRLPRRWYDCDLRSAALRLVKSSVVPGGFDPGRYVVKRLYATAADGERIPITLLRRGDTPVDGGARLLLHGYGSYGFSTDAEFSVPALSLVDRGWIYAIAHVRGGAEKGRNWFLQAIRANKVRTFTDFIDAAEYLIHGHYARKGRVVIHGVSAGGLLVAAAANLRPDLWGGVIAQAPFVDMLNTMSDAEHPLVPLARPDWGDPLADPAAYDWIAGFSPYENLRRQAYPPVLATSAVPDDRVGYWEPAKWIARLRDCSTSELPALLRVAMTGGHMGSAGRFEALRQYALFWAFAEWALIQDAARSGGARAR
jgi:oligopeptidase B